MRERREAVNIVATEYASLNHQQRSITTNLDYVHMQQDHDGRHHEMVSSCIFCRPSFM